MQRTAFRSSLATSLIVALTSTAIGQSAPSTFGTVYNIGDVPLNSPFNIAGAVTGNIVGDGDPPSDPDIPVAPSNLLADFLDSHSQLNLFDGGTIAQFFYTGPLDGSGSNIEVNIFGGLVPGSFSIGAGSTANFRSDNAPSFVDAHSGGMINIHPGGSVGDFCYPFSGSTLNVIGGSLVRALTAGSTFNLADGSVGSIFDYGDSMPATGLTTFNISGGTLQGALHLGPSSRLNMSGGEILGGLRVDDGNQATFSGGTIHSDVDVLYGGALHLIGTSFEYVDLGLDITAGLVPGRRTPLSFNILQFSAVAGTLVDGTQFNTSDWNIANATVTVTLVLGGDFNNDLVAEASDITAFVDALHAKDPAADVFTDSRYDFLDAIRFFGPIQPGHSR